MQDTNITEINKEQVHNAKILAGCLSTPDTRKRGMINILGLNCVISYFRSRNIKVNTSKSIYKIPALLEEFKICDMYLGSYRIDVITLYRENRIKIPKIHSEYGIMPNFYFIVQIGSKIKEAKMVGFIDSKSVVSSISDTRYYYPSLDNVFGFKKFISLVKRPLMTKSYLGKHVDCLALFLRFLDDDLSSLYKKQMIQHLMNCEACRAKFIDALEFERVAGSIQNYPNLIKKYTGISTPETMIKQYLTEPEPEPQVKKPEPSLQKKLYKVLPEDEYIENEEMEYYETGKKLDRIQMTKKFIEQVFNDIPKFEMPPIKTLVSTKKKRIALVASMLIFILTSFVLISTKDHSNILQENEEISNYENENYDYGFDYDDGYTPGKAKLIPKKRDINDFIIKQPGSGMPVYTPSVNKVSWEAPESLVKDQNYIRFLQLVGKNVKLNLQNDLLLVNDVPTSKVVKVDIKLGLSGDISSIKIINSSGSPLIDKSVKKVITDTLKYMKPPSKAILPKSNIITLCIELN